jgi:hypothetical protein
MGSSPTGSINARRRRVEPALHAVSTAVVTAVSALVWVIDLPGVALGFAFVGASLAGVTGGIVGYHRHAVRPNTWRRFTLFGDGGEPGPKSVAPPEVDNQGTSLDRTPASLPLLGFAF